MKYWVWLKEHAVWILGGLLTILGILFAVKYERDKMNALKAEAFVSKTQREIDVLRLQKDHLLENDTAYVALEKKLDAQIVEKKKEIIKVREDVEGRTDAEIAIRFNELYPRS